MVCNKCGKEVKDDSVFCPNCGQKIEHYEFWDLSVEFDPKTMKKSKIVQSKKIILPDETSLERIKKAEATIISLYSSMDINNEQSIIHTKENIQAINSEYHIGDDILKELDYRLEKMKVLSKEKKSLVPVESSESADKIEIVGFARFLVFSILTLGIYGFYTMYRLAKDMNVICNGDGKRSPNFFVVCLLSLVTCDVYGYYWYYMQAKRLYEAAPGYGVTVKEKGSTILLWMTVGSLLFGLGPLIGFYKLFKNRNLIANQYNAGIRNSSLNRTEKDKMGIVAKIFCILGGLVTVGLIVAMIVTIGYTSYKINHIDDTVEDYQEDDTTEDYQEDIYADTDEFEDVFLDGDLYAGKMINFIGVVCSATNYNEESKVFGVTYDLSGQEKHIIVKCALDDDDYAEGEQVDVTGEIIGSVDDEYWDLIINNTWTDRIDDAANNYEEYQKNVDTVQSEETQYTLPYKLTGTYQNNYVDPIYGASISFYSKNDMDLADVAISKKFRETVKIQGNVGYSIDGTELFTVKEVNGGEILVEFSEMPDASGWYINSRIYKVKVDAPDGGVTFRSGPGVGYEELLYNMIPNGEILIVTEEQTDSQGGDWGYTVYNGVEGWIALSQVTLYESYPDEGAPVDANIN